MRTPTETSKKMDNPIANWRLALRSKGSDVFGNPNPELVPAEARPREV